MSYVELHCRSAFSFLRGASHPEHLAETAAQLGLPAMAVCDRDGVYGAPRFFGKAREHGVRPIIGAELTLEDESILPVLVENRTGYQNLCRLLTRAHLRSEKGQSRVRWDELSEFAEGLVALTGDVNGPLAREILGTSASQPIRNGSHRSEPICNSTLSSLERLFRVFNPKNVFVEIQRHHIRGEEKLNAALIQIAGQHGLPLVATNGVCYATATQRPVFDVFTCIRHHTHLDAAGKLLSQNSERHLKSASQMRELFRDLPEAVENTLRLTDRLEFTLENLGYEFPRYPVSPGETMDTVLRQAAFAGARNRYRTIPEKVRRQLETELALIAKLGVAGYFLIVWDIVNFCREQNIMAQGRGSAANSTVCFCLGITAVDPLKFDTLFERFLTEGRKNAWPDIDIDLPSGDRRERVIQEVYQRYGKRGAAMTANVITYRGRSAAREIGKALNLPVDVLDRFSNLFANGDFPETLDLAAQIRQSGLSSEHPRALAFGMLYRQMGGLPRHLGQHSGGMIICQGQLDSIVPLENASMPGRVVAQWDKDDCEDLGIIKVDLLGLGMMSVLQDSVELTHQLGRPLDLAQLPPDDPLTFKMAQEADTVGVFQIESRAQMATLPRMKPENFYDLCIEVAIIRPGPIQGHLMHPYLRRRAGREEVTYYHDDLKPVLDRTLGVPLFQEQMLQMAMIMADFTGNEAEELRRALSFHRSDEHMRKVERKLRAALERKNFSPNVIEDVIGAITSFALYGFPESHAISFAHLAYASAYLKAHRAPEFYTSLLNNQPMGFYSSATLIKDGQRHGVKFLPVDVMKSEWDCTVQTLVPVTLTLSRSETEQCSNAAACSKIHLVNLATDLSEKRRSILPESESKDEREYSEQNSSAKFAVQLGLRVVKALSETGGRRIVAERAKSPFASIEDFKRRVRLNKDELRTLAEIGALNGLAKHRREALWEVEKEMREVDLFSRTDALRDDVTAVEKSETRATDLSKCGPLAPMNYVERIQADFAGMDLTIGKHPMALLRRRLPGVLRAADLPGRKHGERVCIAGNVICRQRPGTAKGFVFISLEDETGISNAIVSPPLFEAHRLMITQESFLLIEGKLQHVDDVIHVKAERFERLEHEALVGTRSYDFH